MNANFSNGYVLMAWDDIVLNTDSGQDMSTLCYCCISIKIKLHEAGMAISDTNCIP